MKIIETVWDIMPIFNALSDEQKVEILWNALDCMNQYNGRSRWYCVCLAMGYNVKTYE